MLHGIRAPHILQQLSMREDLSRMPNHQGEQLILRWREVNLSRADEHLPFDEIHAKIADGEDGVRGGAGRPGCVTQRHAQACHQLTHVKRLGEIVISPGVERGDLILLLTARRNHDDRCRRPFANASGEIDAVRIGKAQIQQDDIGISEPTAIVCAVSTLSLAVRRIDKCRVRRPGERLDDALRHQH